MWSATRFIGLIFSLILFAINFLVTGYLPGPTPAKPLLFFMIEMILVPESLGVGIDLVVTLVAPGINFLSSRVVV